MNFELGQTVKLKKAHPCGGNEFEIVRVGADVKIKCLSCGHVIMLDREKLAKAIRNR